MGFWELAMTVAFLSTALTLSVLPGPHAHVRADHPELEAVASAAVRSPRADSTRRPATRQAL